MRRALGAVVLHLGLLTSGVAAQAATVDTLRLAKALEAAQATNPMLKGANHLAAAAAERVGPAGALPDPQLQFGLMNRMVSEFGSTADPMTMNQVQLMQMLPWPGKLGGARRAASHIAAAAAADALDDRPACSRRRSAWRTTKLRTPTAPSR